MQKFVHNLSEEIDLNKIDYIIINHGEMNHGEALPELMKHILIHQYIVLLMLLNLLKAITIRIGILI